MDRFLEQTFALICIVVGLSHLVQPRVWVEYFTDMFKRPGAGFTIAMWTLPYGLVFGLGHNNWRWGIPLIVTVCGWGWILKGTLYAVYPQIVGRIARSRLLTPRKFQIGGVLFIVLGLLVGWAAWMPVQ